VWSEPDDDLGGFPRGIAFVAYALGFTGARAGEAEPERAPVRVHGRWTRVSLSRGHVLWRGPAHTGMTPVRATGAEQPVG
jgi:hypothetical protein